MRPAYIAMLATTAIALTGCGQAPKHASTEVSAASSVAPAATSVAPSNLPVASATPASSTPETYPSFEPALNSTASLSDVVGKWSASDHMTSAVTGDVDVSEKMIKFDGGVFAVHAVAGPTVVPFDGLPDQAVVFAVDTPADPLLTSGNHLCDGDASKPTPIRWFVVWKSTAGILINAFTQPTAPQSNDGGCGDYRYEPSGGQ